MIDASLTKSKLEDFARQVETRDPATAVNLRALGDAVVGGPTADAWAYSDIRAMLNPDRISDALGPEGSSDLLARGLEVIRNSLVLLPLAITWFGIALAVDGYYKLLDTHKELAGQSFIFLWQSGFEGSTPLPLGTLAAIDALLLTGVFVLTLFAYVRSAWVSMQNRAFGARFSQDLSQVLAEAELILAPRRGPQLFSSIQKFEQNAQSLLHELGVERQHLADLARRREHELGDLSGITDNMKNTSVVFMSAAQSLANTLTATLASLDGVAGTMRGLAATQQEVMNSVRNVAGPQSGMIRVLTDQQLALQDTVAKFNSLVEAQKASLAQMLDTPPEHLDVGADEEPKTR
jgi:hypothetical protein